jgi:O-acetylhomoserine/O-acetylserine sulfhydrylase-like pyridoxal-dependent enzyme
MVYSNDPNAVDAHIPVSYTVEPATISVDPVSISAEPLVTGESSTYQVSIANTGGFDLDYEINILFPELVEQSGSIGMVYNKKNSASMATYEPFENRSSGMGQNNQSQTLIRDGHEVVIFDGFSPPDYF